MNKYTAINSHHIGASHIKNTCPCEDYSLSYSKGNFSAVAISDGHGDKNCPRSADGARIACETIVRLLENFCLEKNSYDYIEESLEKLEEDTAELWKKLVLEDLKLRPFSEEELKDVSAKIADDYRNFKHVERAYGCTLIAAAITDNYWFALQIGDGICTAVFDDGVYIEPIPEDENCCGNRSTSICSKNSAKSFRHYYGKVLPIAVFVVSDGVQESFDITGLHKCFYSVAKWISADSISAMTKLDDLLPKISENGSGDDVSLSGFVLTDKFKTAVKPRTPIKKVYEEVYSRRNQVDKQRKAVEQNRIAAEEISQNIEDTNNAIERLMRSIKELKENLIEYEEEYEETVSLGEQSEVSLKSAEDNLKKAEDYLLAAEKYWSEKYSYLGVDFPKSDYE